MLISHKHKFIFIHCPKTGGSAVTVSLSRYLGPWDIQLGCHVDTIAQGVVPTLKTLISVAQPRSVARLGREVLHGENFAEAFNREVKRRLGFGTYFEDAGHATAADIKRAYPKEWESYHKFCIIRNPFDRLASFYNWKMRGAAHKITFIDFLRTFDADRQGAANFNTWLMYTLNDYIAVDSVLRYETLHEDLSRVLQSLKITWDGWLPNVKPRINIDVDVVYDRDAIKLVETICQKEIAHFGYQFRTRGRVLSPIAG